jgi:hypothetical protein
MHGKLDLTDLSRSWFLLLFAVCFAVAALPVLVVDTLPLVDYPNHLARMHIIAAYDSSPFLRNFYAVEWRPVPNLAMDAIIPILSRTMPLDWAGKTFILLTFFMIAGGTAALHRVLFRRWSAWPLLAFLLLYNRSLLWGFGNFLFGVGLALVALALWIGLRERPAPLRVVLGAILSLAIFFAHFFAFGAYGLLIVSVEVARLRRQGRWRISDGFRALSIAAVPFILPVAIFAGSAHPGGAGVVIYSRFVRKLDLLFNVVDNYYPWFDITSLVLLVVLFGIAAARRKLALSPVMAIPLIVLCAAQLAMPNRILGAAGVDHRMPLVLALVLIGASSVALADRRRQNAILAAFGVLFLVRMSVITVTWIEQDRTLAPMVAALEHLPPGSRVAVANNSSLVHVSRRDPPLLHLAALAVVGADAFVPTLFAEPGQQPLALTPDYAALAAAASPGEFCDVLAAGRPDVGHHVADALGHYDFILFAGEDSADPGSARQLELRAAIPGAWLFAIRAER